VILDSPQRAQRIKAEINTKKCRNHKKKRFKTALNAGTCGNNRAGASPPRSGRRPVCVINHKKAHIVSARHGFGDDCWHCRTASG